MMSNLPIGVRVARVINFLTGGILILLPLLNLAQMSTRQALHNRLANVESALGNHATTGTVQQPPLNPLAILLLVLLGIFFFWQAYNLGKLKKSAYIIQIVLSGLGLLGFPIGSVLHGIVIFFMLRKDTREVFGMG